MLQLGKLRSRAAPQGLPQVGNKVQTGSGVGSLPPSLFLELHPTELFLPGKESSNLAPLGGGDLGIRARKELVGQSGGGRSLCSQGGPPQ